MSTDTAKEERKKKLEEFFSLMSVPYALTIVGASFFNMTLYSLGGGGAEAKLFGKESLSVVLSGVGWLSMGVMYLLVYLWARPAFRYVDRPDEELKNAIRFKIENAYRDTGFLLAAAGAVSLTAIYLKLGTLPLLALLALAASLLAQEAMLVVYIDWIFSRQKHMMDALYFPQELTRRRGGRSIPVSFKVALMVFAFAMLPFLLVFAAVFNNLDLQAVSGELYRLLGMSSVILLLGLGGIYHGIQKPLNGLIDKMRRVAGGDYVKTRVYFSDEVASLKTGFNEMVDGLREREELRDTFGKYMSIEIARELLKNKRVNLGGEEMDAAVMFCDIRNFTPLSATMTPAQVVDFLNVYFSYITPPIMNNNGVISKFIGDGVMAVYTPLLGSENYAADAVRAAQEMRKALASLNASGRTPVQVRFGIGIQTGKLIAGNIGTLSRLEYTFIGDTVNVASRLESKTKEVGTDILVSKGVAEKAAGSLGGGARFESIGMAALKGKAEPLELYKVL